MVVGIGFGTLLVGAIAERFVARDFEQEEQRDASEEAQLRQQLAVLDARLGRIEDALTELARQRS